MGGPAETGIRPFPGPAPGQALSSPPTAGTRRRRFSESRRSSDLSAAGPAWRQAHALKTLQVPLAVDCTALVREARCRSSTPSRKGVMLSTLRPGAGLVEKVSPQLRTGLRCGRSGLGPRARGTTAICVRMGRRRKCGNLGRYRVAARPHDAPMVRGAPASARRHAGLSLEDFCPANPAAHELRVILYLEAAHAVGLTIPPTLLARAQANRMRWRAVIASPALCSCRR